jgi:hypothetical protein
MRFQLLAARLALAALLLAAANAAIAVAGVRLGLFGYTSGLTLMVPAVAMGLIALLCALVWLVRALKHNQGEGKRIGLIALVGALLFLYPPLRTLYQGVNAPPIHDVTSNPEDPPRFVKLAQRGPGMNAPLFDNTTQVHYRGETGNAGYILHVFYLDLTKPFAFIMPPSRMFWRSFEAVKRMGWTIADSDPEGGRIEATSASFWFGQVTDIVIRIERAGAQGARMDIRAQNERGDKDFGRNVGLLKAYFRELNSK